ncbi:DUF6624 domain-containing protein [Emticicia sp. 17c]|uniref:DUF6624 domain-containing protein n=1 Tax=Emticicia sp. 17c TaxID=3127704 RepID=UPI00301CE3A8
MRLFWLLLITFFSVTFAHAQLNISLKRELDSMYVLDQKYRKLLSLIRTPKADSLAEAYQVKKEALTDYLWKLQEEVDSSNLVRVEKIIAQYGYPGRSIVGTPTNSAVFYVIQHSKVIDTYLPLVKNAAETDEIQFVLYAMMLDRSLMYNQKEQIYGTQGSGFPVINPQTGKKEFKMIIWPIKDPETVNERRKNAGFADTVEENAKRMRIDYKVYTLEDVQKMKAPK